MITASIAQSLGLSHGAVAAFSLIIAIAFCMTVLGLCARYEKQLFGR